MLKINAKTIKEAQEIIDNNPTNGNPEAIKLYKDEYGTTLKKLIKVETEITKLQTLGTQTKVDKK